MCKIQWLVLLMMVAVLEGCVTSSASSPTGSASSVGDRNSIPFNEIVVSLPFQSVDKTYQFLHVHLCAQVDRIDGESSFYDQEIATMIRRMEPRITSRVIEALLDNTGEHSATTTPGARRTILQAAQTELDAQLSGWSHAAEYNVEILVVGIYWTNTR